MRSLLAALTRSAVGLVGCALTTASALVFLALFGLDLAGRARGPYLGIVAYLVIPALFLLGLFLIPVGLALEHRRLRRAAAGAPAAAPLPVIDLNVRRTRSMVLGFLGLTAINVALLGLATYKGAEAMETTEFCGTTCHTVMQPEYTSHAVSTHAGVRCVACHIGPGGSWYVRAKINGARQAVQAMLGRYDRPIHAPVRVLRSGPEICGECHQAARDAGDVRRTIRHRSDDETNSVQETVLLMHVGGRRGDAATGIHWHADPGTRIRYRSDPTRAVIDTVEMTGPDGVVTVFTAKTKQEPPAGAAGEPGAPAGEWRTMDCVDCHNRAAHPSRSPEAVVDAAIDAGSIDAALPYVRRESVRLLKETKGSVDEARRSLAAGLGAFYGKEHPGLVASHGAAITAAGRALGDLYARNVFPAMAVTWGTYPDHRGHDAWPGCIRCHDDDHAAPDGRVIRQDCEICHTEVTPS